MTASSVIIFRLFRAHRRAHQNIVRDAWQNGKKFISAQSNQYVKHILPLNNQCKRAKAKGNRYLLLYNV